MYMYDALFPIILIISIHKLGWDKNQVYNMFRISRSSSSFLNPNMIFLLTDRTCRRLFIET